MSAKYSLLVIFVVAVLLTISSLWASQSNQNADCLHCDLIDQ